ncbi:hypothetical protein ACIQPQ_34690 [Streptomyces sp. NPDC091281]|uniref:hypothetical protein n=1 Tax=Streptomyces sp. NPDC091281 TaxID=3365985 RepID=UPI0037F43451
MPVALAAPLVGALSGLVTYGMTGDAQLGAIAAAAAVVLTGLGCAFLIFIDD